MKVWVVSEGVHYGGDAVKGVFSERDYAVGHIGLMMKDLEQFPGYDHWVWSEEDSMYECQDHYILLEDFEVNIPTPVV